VIDRMVLPGDDRWILQLFVTIRAATEPVSEETVRAYAERHALRGVTATNIRGLLSGLVRRGYLRPARRRGGGFSATRQGRKAAAEARLRLAGLKALLNGR
jgi:hypothetical protein